MHRLNENNSRFIVGDNRIIDNNNVMTMIIDTTYRAGEENYTDEYSVNIPLNTDTHPPTSNVIYWGDNTWNDLTGLDYSGIIHTYDTPGTYIVKVFGEIAGFGYSESDIDREKLRVVLSWGTCSLSGFAGFAHAKTLIVSDMAGTLKFRHSYSGELTFYNTPDLKRLDVWNWDYSMIDRLKGTFEASGIEILNGFQIPDNINSLEHCFNGCDDLDCDFSLLKVTNVTNMKNFFTNQNSATGEYSLQPTNYDILLNSIYNNIHQINVELRVDTYFTNGGKTSHDGLISDGWTITDYGEQTVTTETYITGIIKEDKWAIFGDALGYSTDVIHNQASQMTLSGQPVMSYMDSEAGIHELIEDTNQNKYPFFWYVGSSNDIDDIVTLFNDLSENSVTYSVINGLDSAIPLTDKMIDTLPSSEPAYVILMDKLNNTVKKTEDQLRNEGWFV